jgi:small subunit ribosomal protein S3|uniref:Small ribosomal subunit protein uS3c n=1 Tax=Thorea hispida TaxID=202687 RepID=A0A1C9CAT9_9FLOR|nr:ribosomal protein S3 [Thorea hispida]AOM65479.1 ribosomal protein S3 [Thorea hispida]ARX95848.1 30S ribosomal protein S3 [Thorea hispida]UNJ79133.1 ribosomal protein S3 [Thorea hispida]
MGQKTHPLGFRIGITQKHKSAWFANTTYYPIYSKEDYEIRKYIGSKLSHASIAQIEIQRKINQIEIYIFTARPGIILGRFATGVETLRNELQNILNKSPQIRINIIEITQPDIEATLLGDFISQQLEKRIAFRRVIRQAIQRAQKTDIQGIKIQVAGRLNGAEIARSEWIREGQVPLQTIRADIDYACCTAHTIYGVLGIKVWLFKGEILDTT